MSPLYFHSFVYHLGLSLTVLLPAAAWYFFFIVRTYAVHPFGVTKTRFACGSMVLFDHMFVFFALVERKKDKREKRKYRSAEGKEAPTA